MACWVFVPMTLKMSVSFKLPPQVPAFSSTVTFLPAIAAYTAATRPPPVPTTTTSASSSHDEGALAGAIASMPPSFEEADAA